MLLSEKKRTAQADAPAAIKPRKGKKNPTLKDQLAPPISRIRADAEISEWRMAEMTALNPLRPRRDKLMAVYFQVTKDLYLSGQLTTLKNKVLSEGFAIVDDKGNENHDLLKYFQRPWFNEFMTRVLDTDFYGHTLLNFDYPATEGDFVGEFQKVHLIPRGQVIPELGEVLLSQYDVVGVPFRDPNADYTALLLEVAMMDDEGRYHLGILNKAAPQVFQKRHSMNDWSRRSEKFGMPLMALKTDVIEDALLEDKKAALSNMGSNGWMIMDENEELEIKESSTNQDGAIYKALVDNVNDEIAYLIAGQVATSQETGSRSGGEVHERVQEHYIQARMRFLHMFINYELFPFLKRWNYPLAGHEFKWRKWIDEEQAKLNPPTPPGTDPTKDTPDVPNAGKKAKKVKLAAANFPKPTAQASAVGTVELAAPSILGLFNEVVIKLHSEQPKIKQMLKSKQWQALMRETGRQLSEATEEGYGQKLAGLAGGSPDAQLLAKFAENVFIFSANKNYQLLTQLNDLLVTEKGDIRPFADYKKGALALHEEYNVTWLRAEYDTAVGTAQIARKWQDFQKGDLSKYYLKYSTVGDARVRPQHVERDGITLPVDDPWWNLNTPPLGFKCRCTIVRVPRSTSQRSSQADLDGLASPAPGFGHNAAKTGVIFPEGHTYSDIPEDMKPVLRGMAKAAAPKPNPKTDG